MTTRKDQRETEAMLSRLANCLYEHAPHAASGRARSDAESLRRISMTLHRWHELECGNGNYHGSWRITRGRKAKRTFTRDPETQAGIWEGGEFTHDDDGTPWMERHHYLHGRGKDSVTYTPISDRERSARKRLVSILKRYPGLQAYVHGDPRGAALYIIRPGDVPEGATVDSCYSRGIAVYR